MNRIYISLVILSVILISGCTDTKPVDPVNPDNITVNSIYISMAEYQELDVSVTVANNANKPIDSVTVTSFGNFDVLESEMLNIPGKADDVIVALPLGFQIKSPGYQLASNTTDLTISYASGRDGKGKPIIQTKTVPVETIVFPDAELQLVGFVKDMQSLLESPVEKWELKKGENATISFSVKNNGQTTIDENTLVVHYNVENGRIGGNDSFTIEQAMAKGGTSYTRGLLVPVMKDAPNGETDVVVSILYGDIVIDTEELVLKVKL
jgi:hypothetical protein